MIPYNRKTWLLARDCYEGLPVITASRIPSLLSLEYFGSPNVFKLISIVHDKKKEDFEETRAMRNGIHQESFILSEINLLSTKGNPIHAKIEDGHPYNIKHVPIKDNGNVIGHIGATIDAWLDIGGEKNILEIKTTHNPKYWNVLCDNGFCVDGEGITLPSRVMAQLQTQMIVHSKNKAYVGVLINGRDLFVIEVKRCEKWTSIIQENVVAFLKKDKVFFYKQKSDIFLSPIDALINKRSPTNIGITMKDKSIIDLVIVMDNIKEKERTLKDSKGKIRNSIIALCETAMKSKGITGEKEKIYFEFFDNHGQIVMKCSRSIKGGFTITIQETHKREKI